MDIGLVVALDCVRLDAPRRLREEWLCSGEP